MTPEYRLWKGSVETEEQISTEGNGDDPTEENTPRLPPRPIFILSDAKNNPVPEQVSGVVQCVHILPHRTNVFLTSGIILEFKTKTFPRNEFQNGVFVTVTGSPIYVDENQKGFLFVHCKL